MSAFESTFRGPIADTHTFAYDATHDLSLVYRETCTVCGAAALARSGNYYGSALERTCEEQQEVNAELKRRFPDGIRQSR